MSLKPIHIERAWPFAGALIFLACWWWLGGKVFPPDALPMLSAAGTVASVLVGFIITAETIVLGLTGSLVFQKLASTGYAAVLFAYLHEALWVALGFLVVSFVGFFVLESGTAPMWFSGLFVLISSCAILLFVRIALILSSLLRQASNDLK